MKRQIKRAGSSFFAIVVLIVIVGAVTITISKRQVKNVDDVQTVVEQEAFLLA